MPVHVLMVMGLLLAGCTTTTGSRSTPDIAPEKASRESTVTADLALVDGQWTISYRFPEEREASMRDTGMEPVLSEGGLSSFRYPFKAPEPQPGMRNEDD